MTQRLHERTGIGTDRRGLVLGVAGCLAAAAGVLLGAGQVWLRANLPAQPPLPALSQTFTGGEALAPLVPLGILVGAAGLALIATRRVGRLIVGGVVLAAGLVTAAAVGFFLFDGGVKVATGWAQDHAAVGESLAPHRDLLPLPAVLALGAGAVAVAVGIFITLGSRRWPVMGARYERRADPGSGAADGRSSPESVERPSGTTGQLSETAMWAAMERGEDPTATSAPVPPTDSDAQPATRDQPLRGR